jgi:DNA-binding NarL/FixJ family response regulator
MLSGPRIRVLVVDDHPVVCEGVVTQLSRYSDIEIVAHAEDADSAVRGCAVHRLEVVLLDLRPPDALAADVVPRLIEVSPHSRVLLFTAFPTTPPWRPRSPRAHAGCWSRTPSAGTSTTP